MYSGAYQRLIDGGSLFIVIRIKQGALSAKKYLEEVFGNAEILARKKGFVILRSIKKVN